MTTALTEDLQSLGTIGARLIAGSFAPAGTGAPTLPYGAGYSVVRTSEGLFTVTLDRTYQGLISGSVSLQQTTVGLLVAEFGDIDVVTAKTVQIRLTNKYGSTPGTAEVDDLAADADNRVHFMLLLKFSTALDASGIS